MILLRAFILLTLILPATVFGQNSVRGVDFKGVLKEDVVSLKKRFGTVLASGVSLSEIDEMLRYLFKTNHYDAVEAKESQVRGKTVVFLVGAPVELIDRITIEGAHAIDDDEIAEKLFLQKKKRLPKDQILQAIPSVEEMYKRKGYLNARVAVDFKKVSPEKIEVVVKVEEGTPTVVEDIVIETSNAVLKGKLRNLVKGYIGDRLLSNTVGDIRQEIFDYFVDELYLNSNLSETEIKYTDNKAKASIRFSIENPYQHLIVYDGNRSLDSVQLSKAIKLSENERFGLNPAAEIADRLRVHYQKKGFANAKVTYEEQILPRDFIKKVRLKVEEGPRVRIRSIEVGGKVSRESGYYADFIREHSSDLIDLGYYNLEDLELGYKNLVTELQNQGYLQARLQSARSEFLQRGQFVSIKVFIDEGPRTIIRNIAFKGASAFKREKLLEIVKIKPNEPLSLNAFEASIPKLHDYYTTRGYLDMKINEDSTNFIRYNESNTEAQIEYDIQEGPLVEVSTIVVQGNEQTNEDVVLREIDFKPGDKLTSQNIGESEFRLQRLGLFTSVSIRTLETNTQIEKRTVIIEVTEANPGLFNLGASLNNELGDYGLSILAYSGIAYRNLWGTARAISLRGEMNYNLQMQFTEYDMTASYLEPFIFNERIRGRVNFTKSVRVFKQEPERTVGLETNQVGTSLEKDLTRTVKFTWNLWNLANTRKYAIRGLYNTSGGGEEKLTIATLGPQLDWDLRDNPFSPTKGIFYRLTIDYSHPSLGSTDTVNYWKAFSTFRTYVPLGSSKFVWANEFRGGYLKNLSDHRNGQVPEEVMFALGGRSTIRGFDPQAIPSRNEFLNNYGLNSDKPMFVLYNSHYFLIKTEIRFPFWGDFGGVLFYDGGAVRIADVTFDDEYRDAAGFGLRYNTPVGPVSAELAFKLDRRDVPTKESPFRFHFSIGAF